MTSNGDIFDDFQPLERTSRMRTTINIDDDLLAEAQRLTGVKERTQIIRDALVALIERESALRLARLGGSEPDLVVPGRRRP